MLEKRVEEWNQKLLERGRQEGLLKGRQEGRQEGEARLLLRQLEEKFGPIDPRSRERVSSADPDRLLDWGARLLKARLLQDVFGD